MTTNVPFKEGLYEEISGKEVLIAGRCIKCGQVFFPKKSLCLNCLSSDLKTIHLSPRGKLYSYSTVYLDSEHFQAPYTVGWIDLPEDIRIFSQIRGWQERPLKIGMNMCLSIEPLWKRNEDEVVGHIFRPEDTAGEEK